MKNPLKGIKNTYNPEGKLPSVSCYKRHQNSNYGAHCMCFTDAEDRTFYFSYTTLIAFYTSKTGLVVRENEWGPTTNKHMNAIEGNYSCNERVSPEKFKKILRNKLGIDSGDL